MLSGWNTQRVRQFGSIFIFGALIFGLVREASSGAGAQHWQSMNTDERYYLPMFRTKKTQ